MHLSFLAPSPPPLISEVSERALELTAFSLCPLYGGRSDVLPSPLARLMTGWRSGFSRVLGPAAPQSGASAGRGTGRGTGERGAESRESRERGAGRAGSGPAELPRGGAVSGRGAAAAEPHTALVPLSVRASGLWYCFADGFFNPRNRSGGGALPQIPPLLTGFPGKGVSWIKLGGNINICLFQSSFPSKAEKCLLFAHCAGKPARY